MAIRQTVGKNIRAYRKQKGWTMEKLSVRCKLNYDYLGHVERGENTISVDNLEKIAKTLGVETWKLLFANAPELHPLTNSK